jgi:iron complex outermembrane receptor protein
LTYSATLFWHDWDKLRSGSAPVAVIENKIEGTTHGLEAWGTWEAARGWRLSAGVIALRKRLELETGSTDPAGVSNPNLSNDPDYQWMLRSSVDLAPNHELDATVRHSAELPNPVVPDYTAVDIRYGWRMRGNLELSLTVRNAFDPQHPEFGSAPARSEIERGVLLGVNLVY